MGDVRPSELTIADPVASILSATSGSLILLLAATGMLLCSDSPRICRTRLSSSPVSVAPSTRASHPSMLIIDTRTLHLGREHYCIIICARTRHEIVPGDPYLTDNRHRQRPARPSLIFSKSRDFQRAAVFVFALIRERHRNSQMITRRRTHPPYRIRFFARQRRPFFDDGSISSSVISSGSPSVTAVYR